MTNHREQPMIEHPALAILQREDALVKARNERSFQRIMLILLLLIIGTAVAEYAK